MKANRTQIDKAVKAPAAMRLFLLHGPDEPGSRALAAAVAAAMGAEAERIDLAPATLRADPARLADEAASASLFGGPRHIRVEGAGEGSLAAVVALLEAPAAGNPAVLVAASLRATSGLLKACEASPQALAFASREPGLDELASLAAAQGRAAGLAIDPELARRLAAAAGGDRAVLAAEVDKLVLYLDAAPDRPATLDHAALDLLSADRGEADLGRLVAATLSGEPAAVAAELARLEAVGIEGVPLVRAVQRRLLQLAELRGQVEAGNGIAAVVGNPRNGVWRSEQEATGRQLGRWTAERAAAALGHIASAGRAAMSAKGCGNLATDRALDAVARQAARGR